LPKGNKVGILTYGGGFGCVASDACEKAGLDVAPLSPQTIERLNEVLPERWPHANPVDTVGYGQVTYPCLWPLIEDDNLDAVLVIGGIGQMGMGGRGGGRFGRQFFQQPDTEPSAVEQAEQTLKAREEEERRNLDKLFEYMDKYRKPVVIFNRQVSAMRDSDLFNELKDNGIMMYPTPERAAKVLAHLVAYSRYTNSV